VRRTIEHALAAPGHADDDEPADVLGDNGSGLTRTLRAGRGLG
jgi:hypothetical protein